MSEFQNAMHDFVRASENVSAGAREGCSRSTMERAERELASAGDRLESVMRLMMRQEARQAHGPFG